MSSYFDDASLVMIPSGYKDQKVYSVKPLDGSGDLTFSRASDATRVASNGLIEKVRTNKVLQSNTFSTTWTNVNSTETSGQAGYDGTNNAWLLSISAAGGHITQTGLSGGDINTFSVYAKAGTLNWIDIFQTTGGVSRAAYFDLQNGVVGTTFNLLSANIESVGNGWYRCSISSVGSSADIRIYPAVANNDLSATSGNILIQSAQVEVGDIATDYIATTTAAVSAGPVSGLPRLDYLNSSCPRLLLEPQRTNAILQSENLSSATWTKEGGTITANATASPDGYSNADLFTEDTSTGNHRVYQAPISTSTNQAVTFSVFAKYNGRQYLYLRSDNVTVFTAVFDIQNGTAGTVTSGATSKIENYGNGWYRCILTLPATAAATVCEGLVGFLSGSSFSSASYTGNGTSGAYLWGFQGEVSAAYATSYIPTLSTSVTRVADDFSKTGISSLIGQTEGTLFVDFVAGNDPIATIGQWLLFLGSGTTYIAIFVGSTQKLRANVANSVTQAQIDTSYNVAAGTRYKAALAYKENDFAFYVNGVLVGTDTSGTVPATSSIQANYNTTAANMVNAKYNQALLFKTRLTNAQLAELTTL